MSRRDTYAPGLVRFSGSLIALHIPVLSVRGEVLAMRGLQGSHCEE